jgi:hypothetical protein
MHIRKVKSLISRLARKGEDSIVRWASKRNCLPTPLTDGLEKEDVFIVAYPKSGITWFRVMAAAALYGADPEYLPNTLFDWLVPELMDPMYYKRWQTPMLFKTHELPNPKFRRVVYLVRDGRDVVVSYYHFLKALGEEVDFATMVQPDYKISPCSWANHVAAWLANPYQAEILMIRYEDLKSDAVAELRRFCGFLGISRSEHLLKLVGENSAFQRMRAKELREGFHTFPRDKAFIRRGVVGSFKDEMPKDALETFTAQSIEALSRLGYLQKECE